MKNFKKVISVVIALALVISSFTAVSASKFADVAETANYAEAVGALAALGIVNGTEENGALVFKPENQVTRAEAATMLVGALNMAADAQASATSQFADVNTQAAWAAGYVNVGVAQGFIKGYDASTFGPLDNVTYAQLCVMLTSIAGYGEVAANRGGWPTGYTTTAAQFGMSKGVSASAEQALTKGEVAIMIYNTLQTPMLGVSQFNMLANSYEQLNGKGTNKTFKTLLSDKFDGYVAEITITGTPASANAFDRDYIEFSVLNADWWEAAKAPVVVKDGVTDESKFKGVEVNDAHLQTGKALFVKNDEGDLELIYFSAVNGSKTKVYSASEYVFQADVGSKYNFEAKDQIKFGSQYVVLDTQEDDTRVDVYVNGVETDVDWTVIDDDGAPEKFEALMKKAQGEVRITERKVKVADDEDNVTTVKVKSIFLTCYEIAKVTAVDIEDNETVIAVEDGVFSEVEEIKIDAELVEDGVVTIAVKKNGAVADIADIKKGDVIAFSTGAEVDGGIVDVAGPIEILATNDTVSGTVKSVDEDEATYSIDGTDYYVLGLAPIIAVGSGNNYKEHVVEIVTKTIKADLDPFGRIFDKEVSATADKYAIVLEYKANDDLVLLLADGTRKVFDASDVKLSSAEKTALAALAAEVEVGEDETEAEAYAAALAARAISYKVNARTGEFKSYEALVGEELYATINDGEYNAKSKKLDGNKITEGTLIINAQGAIAEADLGAAANYEVFSADAFATKVPYSGFAFFNEVDDATPFIVLTKVDVLFGENTRFAVAMKVTMNATTEDGDDVDEVIALYEGTKQTLIFEDDKAEDLEPGDVFFFEKNAEGYVKVAHIVYDKSANEFNTLADLGLSDKYNDDDWSFTLINDKADYKLVRGIVFEVSDADITFADYTTDEDGELVIDSINGNKELDDEDYTNGVISYSFADGLKAYVYDSNYQGSKKEVDKFKAKDASNVKASDFGRFENDNDYTFDEIDEDGEPMDKKMEDYANQAIALIVDGDIVDIFVIEALK